MRLLPAMRLLADLRRDDDGRRIGGHGIGRDRIRSGGP